jgi:hypothetical protein
MSSAWKNMIPRRKYRERRQLSSRRRLGMLEKKQDYKKRAQEFHKKERKMENLREKVINKNPDEFYHKMINAKMVNGEHKVIGKKGADNLDKNMKLLELTRSIQKSRAEKLQSQLHLTDVKDINTHTFFVSSKKGIKRKLKEIEKSTEESKAKKEEFMAKVVLDKFKGDLDEFQLQFNNIQQQKKNSYHGRSRCYCLIPLIIR